MKKQLLTAFSALFLCNSGIYAHCQMPCGIYHDDMVYDIVDQYIETMYKGISVMTESKFSTPRERNEFIRWVNTKENSSDQVAEQILSYFLQQKIKPGESDTAKKLESAHKLLFLLVQIKQNADIEVLNRFTEEWDSFKTQFHREGYECEMEKIKNQKWKEAHLRAQGKAVEASKTETKK